MSKARSNSVFQTLTWFGLALLILATPVSADPDATYNAWRAELIRHLALEVDDPWVNVHATTALTPTHPLSEEEIEAVRQQATVEAWDDPAALWLLWGANCSLLEQPGECRQSELEERLRELEPGNAASIVLAIDDSDRSVETLLEATNRKLIEEAAQAKTFNTWPMAGADRLAEAIEKYLHEHHIPDGAIKALFGTGIDTDQQAFALTLYELLSASQGKVVGASRFSSPCIEAGRSGELDVVADCRTLTHLIMETARSDVNYMLGLETRFALNHPFGVDESRGDWIEESRIQSDIRQCRSGFYLQALEYGKSALEASEARRFFNDLAALGPRAGWLAAASRDFEAHPERYTIHPRDCESLREKSPEDRQAFMSEQELRFVESLVPEVN